MELTPSKLLREKAVGKLEDVLRDASWEREEELMREIKMKWNMFRHSWKSCRKAQVNRSRARCGTAERCNEHSNGRSQAGKSQKIFFYQLCYAVSLSIALTLALADSASLNNPAYNQQTKHDYDYATCKQIKVECMRVCVRNHERKLANPIAYDVIISQSNCTSLNFCVRSYKFKFCHC
jgi:hypothetical protein